MIPISPPTSDAAVTSADVRLHPEDERLRLRDAREVVAKSDVDLRRVACMIQLSLQRLLRLAAGRDEVEAAAGGTKEMRELVERCHAATLA